MALPPDLIGLFVVPFNQLGLTYIITGAVAAVIYGEPRFTRDLDLVIALRPDDVARVGAAFPPNAFYVPPREVMEEEARRSENGHFNLIHHETGLKADCYLAGNDPLHHWAMAGRVRHEVAQTPVWVAPIEYVILRKLQWHRDGGSSRHMEDIRAMLRVSGPTVDRPALAEWARRLGVEREWQSV